MGNNQPADANIERMLVHIEKFQCVKIDEATCEYEIILKDVNKGAPSVKKIFASLLNIDIFDIDSVRLHREKQWSERNIIF